MDYMQTNLYMNSTSALMTRLDELHETPVHPKLAASKSLVFNMVMQLGQTVQGDRNRDTFLQFAVRMVEEINALSITLEEIDETVSVYAGTLATVDADEQARTNVVLNRAARDMNFLKSRLG